MGLEETGFELPSDPVDVLDGWLVNLVFELEELLGGCSLSLVELAVVSFTKLLSDSSVGREKPSEDMIWLSRNINQTQAIAKTVVMSQGNQPPFCWLSSLSSLAILSERTRSSMDCEFSFLGSLSFKDNGEVFCELK